jgi:Na+/H+-dicarboxylate symporter
MNSLAHTLCTILIAFSLGIFFKEHAFFMTFFLPWLSLGGTLFLNALMMSVFPLVLSSILLGVSKISQDSYGRAIASRVATVFVLNSLCAVLIGWLGFNLFYPFLHLERTSESLTVLQEIAAFSDLFLKLFPRNIFKALAEGDMIGLVVFSILFAVSMSFIQQKLSAILTDIFQAVFDTSLALTRIVMTFLPLGIFCLVLDASVKIHWEHAHSLGMFFLMILGCIFAHMTLCLFVLWLFVGISPASFLSLMKSSLVLAFATSSSSVTLPFTIDRLEQHVGVDSRLTRFMLPLGTTVNMSGTALFVCASALYLAHTYHYPMDLQSQFSIVFIAWLTSFGIAGIPSACLVALMVVLNAVGIPHQAIALIIGFDRILDMFRTMCNVFANVACTVLVASLNKEQLKL